MNRDYELGDDTHDVNNVNSDYVLGDDTHMLTM